MVNDADQNRQQTETDPRFPSGPWVGFWIQRAHGKQKMRLSFYFAGGKVTGSGADMIGRFSFDGAYDLKTGACVMTKQYLNAHRVRYEGVNEGDGMWLWGLWHIAPDRGGFHLWPQGEEDPTQRRAKEEKQQRVSKKRQNSLAVS